LLRLLSSVLVVKGGGTGGISKLRDIQSENRNIAGSDLLPDLIGRKLFADKSILML
jgi:hypothetical protein